MMTLLQRVFGNLTTWLIAGLLGFAVFQYGQARYYGAELGAAEEQVERAEARAEILMEHQRWQREQMARLAEAMTVRSEQLQRDDALVDLLRQSARDLEDDDGETADWADRPLPGAVTDWLRNLRPDTDDGAGGDDTDDTAAPADPAAGTDQAAELDTGSAPTAGGL